MPRGLETEEQQHVASAEVIFILGASKGTYGGDDIYFGDKKRLPILLKVFDSFPLLRSTRLRRAGNLARKEK